MTHVLRALLLACALALPAAASADYGAPGPHDITVEDDVMRDDGRDRAVPYRLYRPADLEGARPVVIFSHGLGGSTEAAPYLGEHLASHGYLALHVQHPGSDESIWGDAENPAEIVGALKEAMRDPRSALARFQDIPFVVDELERWNAAGPLAGHIDLGAIGMSGHSYGARSTLIAAGETVGRRGLSFKEPRLKAAIAYSPNLPQRGADRDGLYDAIDIPLLHVTGTEDDMPLGEDRDFDPEQRAEPFARIPHRPQYLLVLDGADHSVFGGRAGRRGARPDDPAYWEVVEAASLAFWEAHLKGDAAALAYLQDGPDSPLVARYEAKTP